MSLLIPLRAASDPQRVHTAPKCELEVCPLSVPMQARQLGVIAKRVLSLEARKPPAAAIEHLLLPSAKIKRALLKALIKTNPVTVTGWRRFERLGDARVVAIQRA